MMLRRKYLKQMAVEDELIFITLAVISSLGGVQANLFVILLESCQVGAAHILPTSGAGAHHTLPPTAHHTTPLLVSGHCCTRKPRLLNDQIIREIPIPLLSLNECVSKYSLVMNEFTCSQNAADEGRLLRTYKQNMVHILSHIQTSALNQSRYFLEILD